MGNIDRILAFNREYVASKAYEKHLTDKFPDKKLAVLSCMTRACPSCSRMPWA